MRLVTLTIHLKNDYKVFPIENWSAIKFFKITEEKETAYVPKVDFCS
jgi:hypothetical protein